MSNNQAEQKADISLYIIVGRFPSRRKMFECCLPQLLEELLIINSESWRTAGNISTPGLLSVSCVDHTVL